MTAPSKCPNPGCPFLFDPSQVPPGAVIACPRCGLRFTLAPPAQPGYAAPVSGAATPTEPVSAFQGDLFASVEEPEPSHGDAVERPKTGTRARGRKSAAGKGDELRRPARKSGMLKSILIATLIVSVVGALPLGFIALRLYNNRQLKTDETSAELNYPDLNLQFKKSAAESGGWMKHDSTRLQFNAALFGYQRGEESAPTAWIVGDARKFGYGVRPTDLQDRMMELLQDNFDNVTESEEPQADSLCGLPAKRFQYRATHKKTGDNVIVEVHTLANKAIGIWVYAWAPEREFAKQEGAFQSLRAGLQIAKSAETSIEAVSATKTHRSKSGLFTIKDSDGLWTKKDPATDLDPLGTLWLKGTPKTLIGKAKPAPVDLVVVEVEPAGDPKEQAFEIVKKSLPLGEPILDELTGDPTGDPPAGELKPTTPVYRWKVRYKGADASANKLLVYSFVESGGKLVVAYAACQLKDLPYWEQRLMQIIGSLAPRGK